jgi:hypothetical protein
VGSVIYSVSLSLDGLDETPERSLDWVLVDDERHTVFNDVAGEAIAFLYGWPMYELITDSLRYETVGSPG